MDFIFEIDFIMTGGTGKDGPTPRLLASHTFQKGTAG